MLFITFITKFCPGSSKWNTLFNFSIYREISSIKTNLPFLYISPTISIQYLPNMTSYEGSLLHFLWTEWALVSHLLIRVKFFHVRFYLGLWKHLKNINKLVECCVYKTLHWCLLLFSHNLRFNLNRMSDFNLVSENTNK